MKLIILLAFCNTEFRSTRASLKTIQWANVIWLLTSALSLSTKPTFFSCYGCTTICTNTKAVTPFQFLLFKNMSFSVVWPFNLQQRSKSSYTLLSRQYCTNVLTIELNLEWLIKLYGKFVALFNSLH